MKVSGGNNLSATHFGRKELQQHSNAFGRKRVKTEGLHVKTQRDGSAVTSLLAANGRGYSF